QTGGLDEEQLRTLSARLDYLRSLHSRREEVSRLIAEQEKLTPDIAKALAAATTLQQIEDIYRPFRPKRRTRASIARERGLEPLAQWLLSRPRSGDVLQEAAKYVGTDVAAPEEALAGA